MRKVIFISALLINVNIHSEAQPKLVERISKGNGDFIIPYEKYVLSNGITLIIHEDHSDPLVHVDVTCLSQIHKRQKCCISACTCKRPKPGFQTRQLFC